MTISLSAHAYTHTLDPFVTDRSGFAGRSRLEQIDLLSSLLVDASLFDEPE